MLKRLSFTDDDLRAIASSLGSGSHLGFIAGPRTRRTRGELAEELLLRLTGRQFKSAAEFRRWISGTPVCFMGIQDRAERVAFVVEHTGADISWWSPLREALTQSVRNLTPAQSFNIVLLDYGSYTPMNRGGLVPAMAAAKQEAERFMGRSAAGTSDTLAGLRFALNQDPQVVFWVEDGSTNDDDAVIDMVRRRHTRIHTVAMPAAPVQGEPPWIEMLERVARETGGIFKRVSMDDVRLRDSRVRRVQCD